MRNWMLAALTAIGLLVSTPATALDVGPAVGSQIPTLEAHDAEGKVVHLADISGPNGTVLVFFRSASWCPFCQAQLIALKDAAGPLELRGYKLAAISYDSTDVLAAFAKRRDIPYVLLSDAGSRMIDAFKLRDPQYPPGNLAYGVPQPSIFIISPTGVVQAKLAEEGYKNRPPVEAVVGAVEKVIAH